MDALPGAKTIDELTKQIRIYWHSGWHMEPNTDGQQAGASPVDRRDAQFIYNMTKLLLSQIYSLVSVP